MSKNWEKSNQKAKLSDAYVSWITLSQKQRTCHLYKSSFLKDKSRDKTVITKIFIILDIFIAVLNYTHCVCKKGYYLAIISTMVETDDPASELKPAFDIIGDVLETFITIGDLWEPIETNFNDNVTILKFYF
jgi:RAB protein geranylgeranyltransferase component A